MEIGADGIENKIVRFSRSARIFFLSEAARDAEQCYSTRKCSMSRTEHIPGEPRFLCSSLRCVNLVDALRLRSMRNMAHCIPSLSLRQCIEVSLTILKFQFANDNHPLAAVLHPDIAGTFAFILLTIPAK